MQVNINSINAHFDWMANSANNIANVNTDGYKSIDTTLSSDNGNIQAKSSSSDNGVNLAKELVDQVPMSAGVEANVKAIETQEKMIGSVIDMLV